MIHLKGKHWSIFRKNSLVDKVLSVFFFRSNYGALREIAKRIGFGEHIEMKLLRLNRADAGKGTQSSGMNSDLVAGLEMLSICSGCDMLQGEKWTIVITINVHLFGDLWLCKMCHFCSLNCFMTSLIGTVCWVVSFLSHVWWCNSYSCSVYSLFRSDKNIKK